VIFFTRELYDGIQPNSGWERRAEREWSRAADTYRQYLEVISPRLPASVRQLCGSGLHDGVIRSGAFRPGELELVIDLTNALSTFGRRAVRLTFRGVSGRIGTKPLVGRWWLYEEGHLRPRGRFEVRVLFDDGELAVEADELLVERLRKVP
jgi:hypothetical protein